MSYPQQPTPPDYGGYPAGPPVPQPKPGTNGLAVAGFILAFLLAPIGLILSVIGLIQAGKRGQKGKGLAIGGIIISLIFVVGGGLAIAAIGSKVATLVDPGCTVGKSAILDNDAKVSSPATIKEGLQATIDGLKSAEAKANHDNVRNAVKALEDDYTALLATASNGTPLDPNMESKLTTDGNAFDALCTISK